MVEEAYVRTVSLLRNNKEKLDTLAGTLLEKEVIFKEDLERIFGKRQWDTEDNDKLMNAPMETTTTVGETGTDSATV
jgi:cell division protease FtsH